MRKRIEWFIYTEICPHVRDGDFDSSDIANLVDSIIELYQDLKDIEDEEQELPLRTPRRAKVFSP